MSIYYGGLLEARVRDTVCRISPIPNKGLEILVTLIRKMEHVLEEYYIEPDLIKKPEVEKDDELSGDWISDEFVSVEDGEETNTLVVSEPNDDNKTNTIVEADERNDDDRMNATVVGERDNGNEKEREQSDNNVIIIAD